jgi:DNA-directed RNA polymerase subunit M/transcription elongation factor TFIIS
MIWGKMPVKAQKQYLGGSSCPKCGSLIIAAEASQFMGDKQIRHKWSCDECGYEFHTLISLSAETQSSGSQALSRRLPP